MYVTSTHRLQSLPHQMNRVVEENLLNFMPSCFSNKKTHQTMCGVSKVLEKQCHTQLSSTQQQFISRNLFTYSLIIKIFTRNFCEMMASLPSRTIIIHTHCTADEILPNLSNYFLWCPAMPLCKPKLITQKSLNNPNYLDLLVFYHI